MRQLWAETMYEAVYKAEIADPSVLLGDVNGDSKINVPDVILLQKYLLNFETLDMSAFTKADCSGDGNVNAFDLSILKRRIFA